MGTSHRPCRHTGLHPFPAIFWLWAFQSNVFKSMFSEKFSQLFQCYLSARVFLHRNPWLSLIFFHQVSHYFEVLIKILALLTHQLLDTVSRSYNGISVHWEKESRFMETYSALNTWNFFPSFPVSAHYMTAWLPAGLLRLTQSFLAQEQ